jgi:hypothetical protein
MSSLRRRPQPWTNPSNPRSSSPGKALILGAFILGIGLLSMALLPLFGGAEQALFALPPLVIGTGCLLYAQRLTKDPRVTTCRNCGW